MNKKTTKKPALSIAISDSAALQTIFGANDSNLRLLENLLDVTILMRDNALHIYGKERSAKIVKNALDQLTKLYHKGVSITSNDVEQAITLIKTNNDMNLTDLYGDKIIVTAKNRIVTPKSVGQKEYIEAIKKDDIVFGIGPAGTGKTYLAMAMAISFLMQKLVDRIILTRPAVEAGEKLGFLPGTLHEKVDPYLRPLYDALHDMMDIERASKLIESGVIEVAPIAYMRGRTLNDSFIILDEAQNTTHEQMKMFLTRLGSNSKTVVTGDITQVDLPSGKDSGLIEVISLLKKIKGISFHYFSEKDVVRHKLVKEIIKAYETFEQAKRL